jgi:phosphomannomutase/phosphoglucomutase
MSDCEQICSWKNLLMEKLRLFGTSGIRGLANTEITPELAVKIGLTFATFLGNEGKIIVGRDVRLFAEPLSDALISGLVSGGINVDDCGIAPTPAILWTLKKRELNGAIVVTGSHTPKNMIGLLIFMKDTSELSYEQSITFEKIFFNKIKRVPWNQVGKRCKIDISKIYFQCILENVNVNKISSLNYKIILDPGNGAAANYCSEIFDFTDVKTIFINNKPDGLFPNRDPYPRPSVLGMLSSKVCEVKADFGSATDGDGDRSIFVDDQGKTLWGDVSGTILAKNELVINNGGTIVAPVNSSRLINWVCDTYHGKLVLTKIGPPAIVTTMKKENAIMGLEETGKNIWPNTIYYGDWILTTLKMLETIAKEKKALSDIVKTLPQFHMKKEAFYCKDNLKQSVLTQVLKEWNKRKEKTEIVTIDGARINYLDGSWILFKPSGTEPVFRIYSESMTLSRVGELANTGSKIIKKILRDLSLKESPESND